MRVVFSFFFLHLVLFLHIVKICIVVLIVFQYLYTFCTNGDNNNNNTHENTIFSRSRYEIQGRHQPVSNGGHSGAQFLSGGTGEARPEGPRAGGS